MGEDRSTSKKTDGRGQTKRSEVEGESEARRSEKIRAPPPSELFCLFFFALSRPPARSVHPPGRPPTMIEGSNLVRPPSTCKIAPSQYCKDTWKESRCLLFFSILFFSFLIFLFSFLFFSFLLLFSFLFCFFCAFPVIFPFELESSETCFKHDFFCLGKRNLPNVT